MLSIIKKYGLSALVGIIILYLSLSTGEGLPKLPLFPNADKLVHFAMYAALACVLTCDMQRAGKALLLTAIIAVAGASAFGGLLELIQPYFPPRTCDLLDFIADAAGSCFGFILTDVLWKPTHSHTK